MSVLDKDIKLISKIECPSRASRLALGLVGVGRGGGLSLRLRLKVVAQIKCSEEIYSMSMRAGLIALIKTQGLD